MEYSRLDLSSLEPDPSLTARVLEKQKLTSGCGRRGYTLAHRRALPIAKRVTPPGGIRMQAYSRRLLPVFNVTLSLLILSTLGWARASEGPIQTAIALSMLMFGLVFGLAIYIYFALALQTIATKTNTENSWLAWIPIANIVLMLNVAKKPLWWILLFLVPLVNIVIAIMVWMAVAEARNKPNWWGILTVVPFVNLIVPGYLAWSD
ncbi:MAG: hypothetical protein DMG91_17160 [Acidobacteria bacterium]|nr:MAG: hypothetical protein DMG91_17160 [Acidobacteriota bacterium]